LGGCLAVAGKPALSAVEGAMVFRKNGNRLV